MRHASFATTSLLLWAALPAGPSGQGALAAAPPSEGAASVLVVADEDTPPGEVDALYAALAAAGVPVAAPDARLGVHLPPHPERFAAASVEDVTAQLAAARDAFRRLELDVTLAALNAAEAAFFRLPDPTSQLPTYTELLLLRAQAALASSAPERAQAALLLHVRLAPEQTELHPGRYPPLLVQAHRKARVAAELSPSGLLTLSARSAGAPVRLSLDGVEVEPGTALRQTGPHLVVATAPARITRAAVVVVREAEPARFDAVLPSPAAGSERAALVAQLRAGGAASHVDTRRALAALCGVNAVLQLRSDGALLWQAGRAQVVLTPADDDVIALASAVKEALARPPAPPPPTPRPPTPRGVAQAPSTPPSAPDDDGLPWLWIGSAGGAAALAATAGVSVWLAFALTRPAPAREVVGFCCRTGGQ